MSITHWLIVLAVVVLVFGTKKLRNIGSDLGGAVKGFKEGMKSEDMKSEEEPPRQVQNQQGGHTIEGEVKDKTQTKA